MNRRSFGVLCVLLSISFFEPARAQAPGPPDWIGSVTDPNNGLDVTRRDKATGLPTFATRRGQGLRVQGTPGAGREERAVEFIFRALTRKDSESRAIRFPQRYWRLARLSGLDETETRAIIDLVRVFVTDVSTHSVLSPFWRPMMVT